MSVTQQSGPRGKLIYEKNWKSILSCLCTFKQQSGLSEELHLQARGQEEQKRQARKIPRKAVQPEKRPASQCKVHGEAEKLGVLRAQNLWKR